MLLELHAHTSTHSKCSHTGPVSLVKQILRKGLRGIILTEHHYLWSEDEIAALRHNAEVDVNFLIMSGQEVEAVRKTQDKQNYKTVQRIN